MSKSGKFAKLPGFRDFPPEDLALRNHVFAAWRRVSRRYGFVEYDGPPLEELDLYTAKSGDEIVDQLYQFSDKGDRHVALRPEMTPSLARILAVRSRSMPKPIRWFSIPQLFRYERQQRGRLREHFQWNVDLVGEGGVESDAEVLAVALEGLRELGLESKDVCARVSHRALLSSILQATGVSTDQMPAVFSVIDRIEREPPDRIAERLRSGDEAGLDETTAKKILDLFQAPGLDAVEEAFAEHESVVKCVATMRDYLRILDDLGFSPYVEFDLTIVRGLAYYTGIVFEIFDRTRQFRAICGGGRYDHLLEHVGGDPLPAVGFGMGDVVLSELLKERSLSPEYTPEVDYFIVSIAEAQEGLARRVASAQRGLGRSVIYGLGNQSVKKQFSAAAAAGAASVIVLGPDEVEQGRAVVRDMKSGGERQVPLEDLLDASRVQVGAGVDRSASEGVGGD